MFVFRNMKPKKKGIYPTTLEKCPYCSHNKLWTKKNGRIYCRKCKKEVIKNETISVV